MRIQIVTALFCGIAISHGADFTTTLTLDTPVGSPQVTAVEVDWTSNTTSGIISEVNLTDLTFRLMDGSTTVYEDVAMINSVVQSIGGVAGRSVDFNFDFGTNLIGAFDNDASTVQGGGTATGTTYNIYAFETTDYFVNIRRFFDGNPTADINDNNTVTQNTVPEPGFWALFTGVAALGLAGVRRRFERTA